MRQKKWVNCPACGAKASMEYRKAVAERFAPFGYAPIAVKGLDGYFCSRCGDGFWSLRSERRIAATLGEEMARQDTKRVVASKIASVREAAKAMNLTPQAVHKMMRQGRLRYVFAGDLRLPIRSELEKKLRHPLFP